MVRFSLSPKITLRKEKTRKNSENKDLNVSIVQLFLNHSLSVSDFSS